VNGKIRYTSGRSLYYFRGSKLLAPPGYQQYHDLSTKVASSRFFCGPRFSAGDARIVECSERIVGTGNLGTWVFADQNHHFEYVVNQLERLGTALRSAKSPRDVDEAVESS
jgi:hypothetical protein